MPVSHFQSVIPFFLDESGDDRRYVDTPVLDGGEKALPLLRAHVAFPNPGAGIRHQAEAMMREIEQKGAISTRKEFIEAVNIGNMKAREDLKMFMENALFYMLYAHNADMPKSSILFQCADGRVGGPEMFAQDPLIRFHESWMPMAGIKMSQAINAINDSPEPLSGILSLLNDPAKHQEKERLFDEFEMIFGKELRYQLHMSKAAALAGKKLLLGEEYPEETESSICRTADLLILQSGDSLMMNERTCPIEVLREKMRRVSSSGYPITLELQSHSTEALDDRHHGCGALDSNTQKALQITALKGLALNAFISERYSDDASRIKTVRTHHMTGVNERVLDAEEESLFSLLSPEMQEAIRGEFTPLFYKDKELKIVRVGKANPSNINVEHHNEFIIRFSQNHKANGLDNESVLEQTMPADDELAEALAVKLISISEHNRIAEDGKRGVFQPIFFHLDAPMGNESVKFLYDTLYLKLMERSDIQARIRAGVLMIVQSESRYMDISDPKSLELTFLPEQEHDLHRDTHHVIDN